MNSHLKFGCGMGIALVCLTVGARVVPYVKFLNAAGSATSTTLTIPAGKVVIFDHMQSTATVISIRLNYNTADSGIDALSGFTLLGITNPTPTHLVATPAPIRLYAGWAISNQTTSGVMLYGLAMDADDLYAGVGSEIDSLRMASGTLLGGIQLDSPRPVVAEVEQSENLKTWAEAPAVEIQKTSEPDRLEFEAAPAPPGVFYRVRARARQ